MNNTTSWFRAKCLATIKAHENLGMNQKAELMDIVFDIKEVASFMRDEDDDNNEVCQISLKNGHSFSINMTFDEFLEEGMKL